MNYDTLYSWVKDLPIIDWHNHLDMRMLAEDSPLGSLYEVWVKTDPYKHRVMRICGESERLITGDAIESDKWEAWMRTLPKLVGNPLFAWAKMEVEWLERIGVLGGELQSCRDWWKRIENVSLAEWSPTKLLKAFNVEYLSPCVTGTMDIPVCSIGLNCNSGICIAPSLRMNAGDEIDVKMLERFHAAGCRVVDVSIDDVKDISVSAATGAAIQRVAAFAAEHDWTMLLHIGALRDTSSRLRVVAGPAGGFAGMCAPADPAVVVKFLNFLDSSSGLPRTILLSLNPEAHAALAVLAGSFPGKVQLGPAWWWCDHEEGIRDVLEKNAAYGVLSTFVGMTTDSRSLLSFVRHDYFRRILCRWMAEKIASGAFPSDEELLKPILENICYNNAKEMI